MSIRNCFVDLLISSLENFEPDLKDRQKVGSNQAFLTKDSINNSHFRSYSL